MPTTANYGLPYPGPNDPPAGASQIEDLAKGTDTALSNVEANLQGQLDARMTGIRLTRTTDQSIAAGVGEAIVFNQEVYAATGISWDGSATVTIDEAGVYALSARFRNLGGANEDRYCSITANGSNVASNSVGSSANVSTASFVPLLVGDQVQATVFDEGGGSIVAPYLSVFRIGNL